MQQSISSNFKPKFTTFTPKIKLKNSTTAQHNTISPFPTNITDAPNTFSRWINIHRVVIEMRVLIQRVRS